MQIREFGIPRDSFGRATRSRFGKPGGNDYRNPAIAVGLYHLGFVQRFGFGIPLARKSCAENGNPELEFQFGDASFAAIMRRAP